MVVEARTALHVAFTLQCVGDRTWQFLLPLLFSDTFPGAGAVVATAAVGLLRQGTSTLFGAPFATMVGAGSLRTFLRLAVVENLCMLLGALMLVSLASLGPAATDQDPLSTLRFWGPAVLLSSDAICSDLLVQWLSKAWMVQICSAATKSSSGSSTANSLAVANAVTRRLDLVVGCGAPLVVGCGLHYFSSSQVVAVLAVW